MMSYTLKKKSLCGLLKQEIVYGDKKTIESIKKLIKILTFRKKKRYQFFATEFLRL